MFLSNFLEFRDFKEFREVNVYVQTALYLPRHTQSEKRVDTVDNIRDIFQIKSAKFFSVDVQTKLFALFSAVLKHFAVKVDKISRQIAEE